MLRRHRRLVAILIAVFVVAFAVLMVLMIDSTTGFGGPSTPWDRAAFGVRATIRLLWATFSGQPITSDLFP